MKKSIVNFLIISVTITFSAFYLKDVKNWKMVEAKNTFEKRGENAFVKVGDKLFILGGRKKPGMEVYNPKTKEWRKVADVPMEMHHFQAVEFGGEIYVLGALTGDYPREKPIGDVYIYNPGKDQWRKGAEIPSDRRRGSAGVTVYNDKIYMVAGIIDGHYEGHVKWLDEFDPKNNTWKKLPDAPHARDHFQATVVDDKIFVAGGRRTSQKTGDVLNLTVPEVDIYDFKNNSWSTLPAGKNIPTQRAGSTSVTLDDNVLVIGGESPQKLAHNQTEAYNIKTNSWETLSPLNIGRHGTQAAVYKGKVYIPAGAANQGGGPELDNMEVLE